jgi:hypothetical protein
MSVVAQEPDENWGQVFTTLRNPKEDVVVNQQQVARKPFMCAKNANSGTPGEAFSFTVFGDSHGEVFEFAAMRAGNEFQLAIVHGATLRGLNNNNSKTKAGQCFREAAQNRNGVLVLNLGDRDVHGMKWQEYLLEDSPLRGDVRVNGTKRSLDSLTTFLDSSISDDSTSIGERFAHILVIGAVPPTLRRPHAEVAFQIPFERSGYYERIRSTVQFNQALSNWCSARTKCSFVDFGSELWWSLEPSLSTKEGEDETYSGDHDDYAAGVLRPFVSLVGADVHLRNDRTYGVLLEGMRRALGASWCVEEEGGGQGLIDEGRDVGDDNAASFESHGPVHGESPSPGIDLGGLQAGIGFETVHLRVAFQVLGEYSMFVFKAPFHLTPHEISLQLVMKPFQFLVSKISLDPTQEEALLVFCSILKRDSALFNEFRENLEGYLGVKWGGGVKFYHQFFVKTAQNS